MKSVYFDVDNTIVYSASEFPELAHLPGVIIGGREFYVNTNITEKIRDFFARGHTVHVWSAGGYDWAAEVVMACELTSCVYHILTKPDWIFDDKQVTDWMPPAEHVEPPGTTWRPIDRDSFDTIVRMGVTLGSSGTGMNLAKEIDKMWEGLK